MKPLAGAFLLLLFFYFLNPCIGDTDHKTVIIYKGLTTEIIQKKSDGSTTTIKLRDLMLPAFVGGLFNNKTFLAIISSVKVDRSGLHNIEGAVRTRYGNDAQWSTAEQFTDESRKKDTDSLWEDIAAVMKKNKVYVLATSWKKTRHYYGPVGDISLEPFMFVGTIVNQQPSDSGDDNVVIKWEEEQSLKDTLSKTVYKSENYKFISGNGNGIVTTNGTIVFPIVMVKGNKKISSTLYSIDDGQTWHTGGGTEEGTSSGSIVKWNDGKLLLNAASSSGYRKVFETDDLGITWKRSPMFYGVWGNHPSRSGNENQGSAISVPLDSKNVLFFSHLLNNLNPIYPDNLQLWLSDGQRIVCIGTISDNKKEYNAGNSILAYVGKHLYVTHDINPKHDINHHDIQWDWQDVIGFTPLPDFFAKGQSIVRAWRQLDKSYQSIGIPTNGLVGVLGNTKDNTVWADMYNCVNATVTSATSVEDGFQFNGAAGSVAKWPVQSQGQNQLYKFTENAFTITANIKIHSTSEAGDISLIGASLSAEENPVLIGLGYRKEKTFYVMQQTGGLTDTKVPVKLEKEYKVAITFSNDEASVYVDDVEITEQKIKISKTVSIDHFFIGGTGLSSQPANGHSCTVKNVMLFSRALQESELEQFGMIKISDEPEKQTETTTKENAPANPQGSSTDKFSSTQEKLQSVRGTNVEREKKTLSTESSPKRTRAEENRPTALENTFTSAPEDTNTALSKDGKEGSVTIHQNTVKIKNNDNKMPKPPQQLTNTVFQQDFGSDNGAVMQFSPVAGMWLFLWSVIAMTVC